VDVGSEKVASMPVNSGFANITLQTILTVAATKTIQLYAHNATAAQGTALAASTTITYVRLH
jgi:hypothetical protein